jgi:hypothetical protein
LVEFYGKPSDCVLKPSGLVEVHPIGVSKAALEMEL